jgi:hypothetical protein
MRYKLCSAGIAVFMLAGCSTTFKPIQLDQQTGVFPATEKIAAKEILIREPFDTTKYRELLFVKAQEGMTEEYNRFFVESFKNMGSFRRTLEKRDMEALIIQQNLSGKVSSISDLVGLNNLQKQIGSFLVVEYTLTFKGGYSYECELKAIDPETAKTVLHLRREAMNWSGLDQPLFFPLLNGFLEWSQGKQITVYTPPPPQIN